MVSLSVLFDQEVGAAAVAQALRRANRGEIAFETVEQQGLHGELGWVALDGCTVGLLLVGVPLPVEATLRDAMVHSLWTEADAAVQRHRAYAKVFVAEDAGPSPLGRLTAVSRAAAVLLDLQGALGLVDEAGRTIHGAAFAIKRIQELEGRVVPLDLWISVRHFQIADAAGYFMDTLGMQQLGLPDLEAYAGVGLRTEAVTSWLRNLSLYLVQQGAPINSGDTLDGPDDLPWVAKEDGATVEPPRSVVRFTACPAPLPLG